MPFDIAAFLKSGLELKTAFFDLIKTAGQLVGKFNRG